MCGMWFWFFSRFDNGWASFGKQEENKTVYSSYFSFKISCKMASCPELDGAGINSWKTITEISD